MVKKVDVKKVKDNEVKKSKKEVELERELQKTQSEIEEMKKMLQLMLENKNESSVKIENEVKEDEYIDIPANKYIKIMSLTNHQLVLTTEPMGQGKAYVFYKFGEVKNIQYSDISDILVSQDRFAREGKFYIMDKTVVRNYGLEQEYEKILDKKTIDNILEFNNDEIVSIFSNASAAQQQTVVSLLVNKIKNGEDIDLNKVEKISKIYGKSLVEMAKPKEEIDEE